MCVCGTRERLAGSLPPPHAKVENVSLKQTLREVLRRQISAKLFRFPLLYGNYVRRILSPMSGASGGALPRGTPTGRFVGLFSVKRGANGNSRSVIEAGLMPASLARPVGSQFLYLLLCPQRKFGLAPTPLRLCKTPVGCPAAPHRPATLSESQLPC